MSDVILKGSLDKRGKNIRQWSKRSVTLRSDSLEYTHRYAFLGGNNKIYLRHVIELIDGWVSPKTGEDEALCFAIKTVDGVEEIEHIFRAASIEDYTKWFDQLKLLVDHTNATNSPRAAAPAGQPVTDADVQELISLLNLPPAGVDNFEFQKALAAAELGELSNFFLGDRLFQLACARVAHEAGGDPPQKLPPRDAARQIIELKAQNPEYIKKLTFQAYDVSGDGQISQQEFLGVVTRTWYQLFRALSSEADVSKRDQIVDFAESKAGDLHTMAIAAFGALENQGPGGGVVTEPQFAVWCESAKELRAEADGVGNKAAPLTYFFPAHKQFESVPHADHSFQVTIPDNVKPGDDLLCTAPSGRKFTVTVPEGARPGGTLQLQLE